MITADKLNSEEKKSAIQTEVSEIKYELARRYSGTDSFNELVLRDEDNKPIKQGEIHKMWNWFIDTCIANGQKKIGIAAPMEHGKTNQISIGRILKFIGEDKNTRIKLVSCTDAKAREKTNAVKKIIQYSPEYHKLYPHIKPAKDDTWTGHRLVVNRDYYGTIDATLESQSITAEGIGGRCDKLIFDDPIDEQNTMTEGVRKKIRSLANTTWMTRLDERLDNKYKGIVLYVGTAWHEDDLMHFWMQPGSGFTFLKMGVADDFNNITWEIINGDHIFGKSNICFNGKKEFRGKTEGLISLWDKKPKEILIGKCISDAEGEGQRFFDRAYRNKFVSTDEQIFQYILDCNDETLDVEDVMNEENWFTYMGVDLAISKRKNSAYTVFVIAKKDLRGRNYLVDVVRGKFSSPATAAIALGLGAMYNIEIGLVENNAYQHSILEWIQVFKDEIGITSKLVNGRYEILEGEKVMDKLDMKYARYFSKEIPLDLWRQLYPYLSVCGRTIINFRPYTTGKSIMDEKVGLPVFSAEIQSGRWVIPWLGHMKAGSRQEYCGCNICIARKEMVNYPGAKYKDCLMAWFFCSRAMRIAQPRVRST